MRANFNPKWVGGALVLLLSLLSLWVFLPTASSQSEKSIDGKSQKNRIYENYDIRDNGAEGKKTIIEPARESLRPERKEEISIRKEKMAEAEQRLNARIENLRVKYNENLGAPEIVDVSKSGEFLTPPSKKSPEKVVRDFMSTNRALYGLSKEELTQFETRAVYDNPDGRITWVNLERKINGLPVFRSEITAALTKKGELVRTVGELTSAIGERGFPTSTPPTTTPNITAAQAVAAAAESIGVTVDPMSLVLRESSPDGSKFVFERGPFANVIPVELQYYPLASGVVELSWSVQLWQDNPAYYIIVSADKGDLFYRKNMVNEQTQPATYVVYNDDSPAPLSPTTSLPSAPIQAPAIPRTSFTLISEHPLGDPWLPDGATTTVGNNVDSGMDLVAPDGIEPATRASSATRNFNFSYNPGPGIPGPGDSPTGADYRFGEAVNMFFWTNRWHDRMYQLGFTEAARNFQTNNYGRGGLGNDAVLAQGQDFSGTNNANFLTPPDGTPGRMQMFIFTGPNPDRSSGLDQEILIHELTHGTSNRLHNNGNGLNTTMSGGMGEGWSDFYALALLSKPGDNPRGVYAVGGYSTLDITAPTPFGNNYYYGIRRFPHATMSTVGANGRPHNPVTFADIDPTQINLTDGAFPRGPIGSGTAFQVHNIGEIWCAALWEVRARLIERMGHNAGNQRMLQLVTDGMKLDPVNPTLIDGRNAILAASAASGGGAVEENDIWTGFAIRGLGFGASAVSSSSSSVVQSFDTPNLQLASVEISSENCPEINRAADPGETITLAITLSNPLSVDAQNTTVSVVGGGSDNSLRPIPAGGSDTFFVNYTVPSSAQCGDVINLTIQINSNFGPTTKTYALQVGAPTSIGAPATSSSGNIAVPIPDNTTVDIPINVPQTGRVGDVNVKVRLNHTFDGDLVLSLVAPDGTVVPLANNRGGGGDNFGSGANDCSGSFTVFDDQAANTIASGSAPFVGSFRPDSPLAVLRGKQMNGVWRLRVADTATLDTGTVGCAQVEISEQRYFCCGVPGTPSIIASPPPVVVTESRFRGNGFPDPGERLSMRFDLKNIGSGVTNNLVATLLPGGGVSMPGPPQSYGVLSPTGPPVGRNFALTVNGACGDLVTATFQLQDGPLNLGTVSFQFRLGTPVGNSASASNTNTITIPATGTGSISGSPANPYPSSINVAGVTGTVTKVTATINNFSHTFPADVDILLVGPGGQTVVLLSDAGGGTDAVNTTLTFDDAAPAVGATIVSGTFRPTNITAGDVFPAPAPAGPHGAVLSAFNGVNPNGTWSLYVIDDASGDVGTISGGWSLTFTTLDYVCP
jgi:subtilisin-like proprotein convertase family protein